MVLVYAGYMCWGSAAKAQSLTRLLVRQHKGETAFYFTEQKVTSKLSFCLFQSIAYFQFRRNKCVVNKFVCRPLVFFFSLSHCSEVETVVETNSRALAKLGSSFPPSRNYITEKALSFLTPSPCLSLLPRSGRFSAASNP